MLREGDYAAFYQRACERAPGDSPPGLRPLEFTHVMIDEAGQASLMPAVLCCAVLVLVCICQAVHGAEPLQAKQQTEATLSF